MELVRSNFGTNEPLPVEHFFPHFLAGLLRICTEVTSYKIHILVAELEKVYMKHTYVSKIWQEVPKN